MSGRGGQNGRCQRGGKEAANLHDQALGMG